MIVFFGRVEVIRCVRLFGFVMVLLLIDSIMLLWCRLVFWVGVFGVILVIIVFVGVLYFSVIVILLFMGWMCILS